MKSQILKAKNAKGGSMKAYTIADYSNGKPKNARNAANWVTLATLLGMPDFSDAEIDSLADLQLDEHLTLVAGECCDAIPTDCDCIVVTRVN